MNRRDFIKLSALTLLFEGCAYRECSEEDRYSGLWNGLTCEYSKETAKLEGILSEEKAKELKLFNAYHKLIAEVNQKRGELSSYENSVQTLKDEIAALEYQLERERLAKVEIASSKPIAKKKKVSRQKIKKHLVKIKKSLKTKRVKFKKADIKLTRAYLNNKTKIKLSKKYENSNDIKLAKAFVTESKGKKIELARAYDKGYTLDTKIRTSLHSKIDTMIKDIDAGKEIDNKTMIANIKLTRNYASSVS